MWASYITPESLFQGLDMQKDIAEGKVTPGQFFILRLGFSGIDCSQMPRSQVEHSKFYDDYAVYLGGNRPSYSHIDHENPGESLTNCINVVKRGLSDAHQNSNKLLTDMKGIYLLVDEYDVAIATRKSKLLQPQKLSGVV
jgi:hypothetical protein